MFPPLEKLRERLISIDDEIEQLEHRVELLVAERGELTQAQTVINRFSSESEVEEDEPRKRMVLYEPLTVTAGARKPPEAPTVPEMITEALTAARDLGRPGLEPKEITEYIRTRWWPTVAITSVGPIAWRMSQRNQLAKDGPLYSLPKEETPAVSPAGASELQGGVGVVDLL